MEWIKVTLPNCLPAITNSTIGGFTSQTVKNVDKILRATLETVDKLEAYRTSILQTEAAQSVQSIASNKHPQIYGRKRGVYDGISFFEIAKSFI